LNLQVAFEQQTREDVESNMSDEINQLRTELGVHRSSGSDVRDMQQQVPIISYSGVKFYAGYILILQVNEYQMTIGDLETKLGSLQRDKGEMEFELKVRSVETRPPPR
jgi:hypothetical protein